MIVGREIFEEEYITKETFVTIIFFNTIEFSETMARHIIRQYNTINIVPFSYFMKSKQEHDLKMKQYTIHIQNNNVSILPFTTDQKKSIYLFCQEQYNPYLMFLNSNLSLDLLINRLYNIRYYFIVIISIIAMFFSKDFLYHPLDIPHKQELLVLQW